LNSSTYKFFGASLDVLDTLESINTKRAYIESRLGEKCPLYDLRDPYELFRTIMSDRILELGHQNLGRFSIESWLTPKPQASDLDLIQQGSYTQFLRNNGFQIFKELLKDFVKAHVFPQIPVMIGVDHSLTGGVLTALSERFGPENVAILVFDAHTDAIPLPIRSGLVQYALEVGLPSPSPISEPLTFDPYTTGNFLFHLIEKRIIIPENLMLIGPVDGPEKLRRVNDERVIKYVHHYDSLVERGVKIISKEYLQQFGSDAIQKDLNQLKCSNLYISLDVDVSAQCGVLATRFLDQVGTETSLLLEIMERISELLSSERLSLVGFDIMEIDIHKIGARLRSGIVDETEDFIRRFISTVLFGLNRIVH
jgi:arginase family enzyme